MTAAGIHGSRTTCGSNLSVVMAHGPDHLLWAIGDDIVDGYFPYADRLGDAIDEVQDAVITQPTPDTLERLFALKRELIEVRRAASPTREVFNQLTNRDMTLIDEEEIVYFRDVYDHVIRLTDEMDNYRELGVSDPRRVPHPDQQQPVGDHEAPDRGDGHPRRIGAVAGIFGMSEAGSALGGQEAAGFWFVTAMTVAAATGAAVFLRRIGWI